MGAIAVKIIKFESVSTLKSVSVCIRAGDTVWRPLSVYFATGDDDEN